MCFIFEEVMFEFVFFFWFPQILEVLVKSVAPILPHLAEDVYMHTPPGLSSWIGKSSVFESGWMPEVCSSSYVLACWCVSE